MSQAQYILFPEITQTTQNWLKVDDLHQMYYEECGNEKGSPVVFLHGGPGSGCNATQRRFFDPAHYRIILLDQRGCGRSTPQGETKNNTTDDLVADIEQLRLHLGIVKWHVFGGSWGSTLALSYAIKYPQMVISLVLRGIFLSRASELAWFLGAIAHFYPEVWQTLIDYLPPAEQHDVLNAYANRIFSDDAQLNSAAAIQWNAFENAIMRLKPSDINVATAPLRKTAQEMQNERLSEVARARVQIHYIQQNCFVDGEQMLKQVANLAHIPTAIVQGRYDMVCPPQTAWALHQAMPHASFEMIADAGHSAMEPGVTSALVAATERFKSLLSI